jgi:hypothetical protein
MLSSALLAWPAQRLLSETKQKEGGSLNAAIAN